MAKSQSNQKIIKFLTRLYANPHELGVLLGYDKLMPIHSEWIRYMFDAPGGTTRVLQAHRGSYKTTALVVGMIRDLLFNPERTHAVIRKSFTDAQKIAAEIQQHFDREPLRKIFMLMGIADPKGEVWKTDTFNVATKLNVTKERNVECYGIGTAITGAHHDVIHLDDIVTVQDRMSKVEREKTKQQYYEYVNVAMTKKDGMISVSGTPWHKEDAYSVMPDPLRYSIYDVKQAILTDEQIAKIKSVIPASLFAANYELKHIADENHMFANPVYGEWETRKDHIIRTCAYLDPSYTGTNTTALAMITQTRAGIHARGWVWTNDVTELYARIVAILKEYKCGTLYVEENADKGFSKRDIQKLYPATTGVYESENKHVKIVSFLKQNFSRLIFAVDSDPMFMEQITDYQEGQEPDDAPDALAALIRAMNLDAANELKNRFGINL